MKRTYEDGNLIYRKPKSIRLGYDDWIVYASYAYLIRRVNSRRPKVEKGTGKTSCRKCRIRRIF